MLKKIALALVFSVPLTHAAIKSSDDVAKKDAQAAEAKHAAYQTASRTFKEYLKMAEENCVVIKDQRGEMTIKEPVICATAVHSLESFNVDELLKN